MNDRLKITVLSAEKIIYEGIVNSVSSKNEKGTFDILPMHINFISIVKDNLVVRDVSGKIERIDFGQAVLKAYQNEVTVFIGV